MVEQQVERLYAKCQLICENIARMKVSKQPDMVILTEQAFNLARVFELLFKIILLSIGEDIAGYNFLDLYSAYTRYKGDCGINEQLQSVVLLVYKWLTAPKFEVEVSDCEQARYALFTLKIEADKMLQLGKMNCE